MSEHEKGGSETVHKRTQTASGKGLEGHACIFPRVGCQLGVNMRRDQLGDVSDKNQQWNSCTERIHVGFETIFKINLRNPRPLPWVPFWLGSSFFNYRILLWPRQDPWERSCLRQKGMLKSSVTMKLPILKGNHFYDVIMNSHVKVLGTETMIDKWMEFKFLTTVPPFAFDIKYKSGPGSFYPVI